MTAFPFELLRLYMQSKIICRSPDLGGTRSYTVLCGRQDHPFVDAQEVSELIGSSSPQWLVDLFGPCELAWRQARPSRILLANVRPEAFPLIENLLIEVLPVISIAAAHWILLEAIDDRLRNRRFICRHVGGEIGICHIEEQEIYEIDRGGQGWCVNFMGALAILGTFQGLRDERTRREENRDG